MVQRVEVESISVTKIWPKSSSSMALLSVHCCPTIQTPTHSPIPTTYTSGHPPVQPPARPPTHSKNQRSDNLVFCNNNLPLIVSLRLHTQPHTQTPTHPPTQPSTHPLTHPPNHPPTQPLEDFTFDCQSLTTYPATYSDPHPSTQPSIHPPVHPPTHQPPAHPTTRRI